MIRQCLLKSLSKPSSFLLSHSRNVSGTAKGKAKLKEGKVLKRASIPKKKGGGSSDDPAPSRGGRAHKDAVDRLSTMAKSCLTAPTPIRYLTEKERWRETEREKLGLISKEKQRELDMIKAQKKEKKEKKEENDRVLMGTPGLDYISLGLVDEEKIPKYSLTVEDGKKLAKEYSRVLMRRHRARQKAETELLRLKKEAVAALPERLKAAALLPDLTPFPANRFMASLTPPIEGYIESVREAAKKHSVKEKLR
ncbi:hypothetical protein LUZ60_011799 [Juncus effusus]|nr:hypothetical protein LUZ60_011799 [Juncus effusus]